MDPSSPDSGAAISFDGAGTSNPGCARQEGERLVGTAGVSAHSGVQGLQGFSRLVVLSSPETLCF